MNTFHRKFPDLLPEDFRRLLITVTAAACELSQLCPCGLFIPPEFLLLIYICKIHDHHMVFHICTCSIPILQDTITVYFKISCVFSVYMLVCTVNFNKHGLPRQCGRPNLFISFNSGPVGSVHFISGTGSIPDHLHRRLTLPQALFTEPKSSIFSFTVALIASKPGARSLRGS